jgi:hypothetical protein
VKNFVKKITGPKRIRNNKYNFSDDGGDCGEDEVQVYLRTPRRHMGKLRYSFIAFTGVSGELPALAALDPEQEARFP